MSFYQKNAFGLLVCAAIAVPSWLIGKAFPLIGGAVVAMLLGMGISLFWTDKGKASGGIRFTSKAILQAAVVLLGFGMNLQVVWQTGLQSLPIILCTITTALALAEGLGKAWRMPGNIATLIGVGSSICGGSAIAATAPVIDADDHEVAQAISVIFLFNVLAAILFPLLGRTLGMNTASGQAFGLFAGTAVNDTSSVTAAAAAWDSMWRLGSQTLDQAVTVKLTRTLAILPITATLGLIRAGQTAKTNGQTQRLQKKSIFPTFILFFLLAAVVTTVCAMLGVPASTFKPFKELSKFLIVMAMAAIGLNSNMITLFKSGSKPILLGGACWLGITCVCLFLQRMLGIW